MKTTLASLLSTTMLLWMWLVQEQVGPPSNDTFADAQVLTGIYNDGSVVLTNATMEPGEPLSGSGMTQTVWYRWVTPEQGVASIGVIGNGGTKVSAAAYTGDWTTLRAIGFATDSTTI